VRREQSGPRAEDLLDLVVGDRQVEGAARDWTRISTAMMVWPRTSILKRRPRWERVLVEPWASSATMQPRWSPAAVPAGTRTV
jgi:hypothetical protein